LQLLLFLQFLEIPSQSRSVADHFCRTGLKNHDDAGLIELDDSLINEFHSQQRFAAPGSTLDDDQIAMGNSSQQYFIEPGDTSFD